MAWWSKYPDAALARDLKEIFADYNPRKIDAANRERLQAILDEYGVVENLVVNKRSVERGFPKGAAPSLVSGHQRVGILLEQKLKEEIPLRWVDVSKAKELALNLALNNPDAQGQFVASGIEDVIMQIQALDDEALGFTGFTEQRIAAMTGDPSGLPGGEQRGGQSLDSEVLIEIRCSKVASELAIPAIEAALEGIDGCSLNVAG